MSQPERHGFRARAGVEELEGRTLLSAGAFDTSFDGDGKVLLSSDLTATDVAVQADGKTVVAGTVRTAGTGEMRFAVERFNVDGSPDRFFGTNGLSVFKMGNQGKASAQAVAIAPDGKIIVVGSAGVDDTGFNDAQLAVARLTSSGALDSTFDGDGKRTFDLGGIADADTNGEDVAVQPDGRIVIVGKAYDLPSFDFFVMRLNGDGSFDNFRTAGTTVVSPGFDGDGLRKIGFGEEDGAKAVKIDGDGNVFVAGDILTSSGTTLFQRVGLAKLNAIGSLVSSFDGDGQASFSLPGHSQTAVEDLMLQAGGKVVIAGHTLATDGRNDFFVARFTDTGQLDHTFGGLGTGFRITDLGGNDVVGGMTASATGGFVVTGSSGGMVAVKYTDDGLLDTTFGSGGIARLGFGGTANVARGPGRRLTLAGGGSFATARLLESGANVVSVGALGFNVGEGLNNGTLIVGRIERLPVPTRVFFSVSGTAQGARSLTPDYTLDKMVQPLPGLGQPSPKPFVDIPANQTFVLVTMTVINDTRVEGIETATFTIAPDPSYEIGTPDSGSIDIADDDGTATDLVVKDDAYVRDGTFANTSFGSATDLQAKTGGAGFNRVSYLKFDLSNFGVIEKARLVVFGRLIDGQNSNVPIQLFSVADTTWTGATLKFNNKPAPGATPLATTTVIDTALRRYEFDVSSYLKSEKTLGHNVVSFMLKSPNTTNSVVSFNSGNAASNKPVLTIVTPLSVGVFTASQPPKQVHVGDEVQVAVKWTVPLGGWRQLSSIDLRLRDLRGDSSAILRFNESTNSFSVVDASGVLEGGVQVVLEKSSFQAAGPTSPLVTVNFVFRFDAPAAKRRFALEVSAINDLGLVDPFTEIGTIRVKK